MVCFQGWPSNSDVRQRDTNSQANRGGRKNGAGPIIAAEAPWAPYTRICPLASNDDKPSVGTPSFSCAASPGECNACCSNPSSPRPWLDIRTTKIFGTLNELGEAPGSHGMIKFGSDFEDRQRVAEQA